MVDMFGRMPVNMRSYIRTYILAPFHNTGITGMTTVAGDTFNFVPPHLFFHAHEISHSMDWHAQASRISTSSEWQGNY